jgi:hypothetical protein
VKAILDAFALPADGQELVIWKTQVKKADYSADN